MYFTDEKLPTETPTAYGPLPDSSYVANNVYQANIWPLAECVCLLRACPGLLRACPGLLHACPGLFHACPGLLCRAAASHPLIAAFCCWINHLPWRRAARCFVGVLFTQGLSQIPILKCVERFGMRKA